MWYRLNPDRTVSWCGFMETPLNDAVARRVGRSELHDGVVVSTVFLCLEHGRDRSGRPLLFETMAFAADGGELDLERHATWADAEAGHERMVEKWSPARQEP